MKDLLNNYKNIIFSLIFGVGITLVNMVVYYLCVRLTSFSTIVSTCIAWVFAVLFAYITNRIWVFESKANTRDDVIREIISFFSCRLATGILDIIVMYIFVELIGLNDVIIKFASNVLVIVLNYVASKLFVFRKRK